MGAEAVYFKRSAWWWDASQAGKPNKQSSLTDDHLSLNEARRPPEGLVLFEYCLWI